jgi:two-component system LytT family sensor kinase
VLAFLWNLGSLVGLALTQKDGEVPELLVAVNFSVLSLLPAILLSVVMGRRFKPLVRAGYVVAGTSVALHFAELAWPSARLHEMALMHVVGGFLSLVGTSLLLALVRGGDKIAPVDLICLVLFTLSLLHFGYGHSQKAWTDEIAWHHAGIPLALIVLLRDYRLLLLETFIRFLVNAGLAGLWAFAFYWAAAGGQILEHAREDGFAAGLLLIAFCASLVLFAYVRGVLQKYLTRTVFRRQDLNAYSKQLLHLASESESESELLEGGARLLAEFVEASRFVLTDAPHSKRARPWAEMELPLRLSRGESMTVLLGPRRAGLRYLPEDLESLSYLSGLLVEQVERLRMDQLEKLAREAELRALQAQVNPHFLFNALNTLYGTIGRESAKARGLVLNLAELFRYCLQRDRNLIPLGEELQIVKAYLEIESLRLQDRLTFSIETDEHLRSVLIPALCVQPLVENAVKHGVSKLARGGNVKVEVEQHAETLRVAVRDNGPGFQTDASTTGLGIGLENVRQRLRLRYGTSADLEIATNENGAAVTLSIPLKIPQAGRSKAEIDTPQPQAARSLVETISPHLDNRN